MRVIGCGVSSDFSVLPVHLVNRVSVSDRQDCAVHFAQVHN